MLDVPALAVIAAGLIVACVFAVAVPDFIRQILERER